MNRQLLKKLANYGTYFVHKIIAVNTKTEVNLFYVNTVYNIE